MKDIVVKAELKGVEEAVRNLTRLGKAVRARVKRKALTKGSQVVNREVKQNRRTASYSASRCPTASRVTARAG
jgi:hypothetical protein